MKRYAWKKRLLCLLLLAALPLLSGCRVRTTAAGVSAPSDISALPSGLESDGTEETDGIGASEPGVPDDGGASAKTRENPAADKKEYDEQADVEIVQGAEREIGAPGEGDGPAAAFEDAEKSANMISDSAEQSATRTVAAAEADRMGVSPDAEEADSATTYYTVLLRDRLSTLFECKRQNVYWETEEDFATVHKTTPEHQLILDSGCYDVSARLTEERLQVDAGWVYRKNPDVIVKMVSASILGSGVHSPDAARALRSALCGRPEWQGIAAVKTGKIVLLSSEMLKAPHLKLTAALVIAKTAYPELFSDVDAEEALRALTEEAVGTIPDALFFDLGELER